MFERLLQPTHLLVILVLALLVFGPKNLPELGKAIGEGIRALRQGTRGASSYETTSSSGDDTASKEKG